MAIKDNIILYLTLKKDTLVRFLCLESPLLVYGLGWWGLFLDLSRCSGELVQEVRESEL